MYYITYFIKNYNIKCIYVNHIHYRFICIKYFYIYFFTHFKAINKLGIFTLENTVTDTTTHLVSLEPRRTLNLLRAITRGLWILEYTWIEESLKAGEWLEEEAYELRSFSRGVEV